MPSKNHSVLEMRIGAALLAVCGDRYEVLPELSLELTTGRCVPDLAIYPKLTFDWLNDELRMTDPPLGVIEILSSTQGLKDITDKLDIYFGAGVKSVWVVIPTFKTIYIITPDKQTTAFPNGTLIDKSLDIRLDVDALFR